MTVPSSGQITIRGLASEKKNGTYDESASVTGPISLYDLFIGGNAHGSGESWDTTNTLSPYYPKPVTESEFIQGTDMPMGMDEWHSYDHDAGDSCSNYTSITLYKQISQDCSTAKPGTTYYINNSIWSSATALLRDSGSGNCISALAGWYYCSSCSQNGTELREWNGSAFINTTGCP
jgi:hypothetical protein